MADQAYKVDMEDFEHDEWETRWYKCPACNYSSIAGEFSFCPNCGVKLTIEFDEDGDEVL